MKKAILAGAAVLACAGGVRHSGLCRASLRCSCTSLRCSSAGVRGACDGGDRASSYRQTCAGRYRRSPVYDYAPGEVVLHSRW